MTDSLTGHLLVATPQIEDGVFHRSVVLLLQHDADGAQGVVLNKVLDAEVDAVLPGWGDEVSPPRSLFQGGPVQVDSALGLVVLAGAPPTGVQDLFGGVGLVDLDSAPEVVGDAVLGVRIFIGYAGWSPGQLEAEVRTGSWYVVPLASADVVTDDPDGLWASVLARQPGRLRAVSFLPEDPSIN